MKIIVFFTSRWRRITSSCMSRRINGSSALNGSSNSMISGSVASARASPTRCCMPPESSSGYELPQAAEPHDLEDLGRFRLALGLLHALDLEAERHVVHDATVGQEAEVLEHHADLPATDLPEPLVVQQHDVLSVEQHLAGRGIVQPVQHPHEGGLARAGEAHDHEHLARRHVEGHVADGGHAARLLQQLGARQVGVGRADDAVGLRSVDLPDVAARNDVLRRLAQRPPPRLLGRSPTRWILATHRPGAR